MFKMNRTQPANLKPEIVLKRVNGNYFYEQMRYPNLVKNNILIFFVHLNLTRPH